MANSDVYERSNDAIRRALRKVAAIVRKSTPGEYQSIMEQRASPHLEPLLDYFSQCAEVEITLGVQLQRQEQLARDDPQVMRHYHSGAGYLQLRFLATQGIRVLLAAVTENYVILEGNCFLPGGFYDDFNIPERYPTSP
ncbi:unnamed protein product [Peniophora sp. CBMAI 1063]|nr:unnamed protein product [Peniophora sp. CBMAI 1063]